MRDILILAGKWALALIALAYFHTLSIQDKVVAGIAACAGLLFLISVRVNDILEILRKRK